MSKVVLRVIWGCLFIFGLCSCETMGVPSRLPDLDYPLLTIRRGIKKALPVEFRVISRDGREYESYPFVRDGKKLKLASNEEQRGVAHFEIRGSRRPYSVDVLVSILEAQTPNSVQKNYLVVGHDDVIAKILLARLKAYLQRSKGEGNVIDDFRVF